MPTNYPDSGYTPPASHEGHDPGRPPLNNHPVPKRDAEHPGYETGDVNVKGVAVFLVGLSGSLFVFFFLCFFLGKLINNGLATADGPTDKWHENHSLMGAERRGQKRQDLTSNTVMQQRELAQVAKTFPLPRVPTDDDNQETADLHSREDLMLNYYSTSPDLQAGKIRIPISQAMKLVEQQGLGGQAPASGQQQVAMYGDNQRLVTMPITTGFARTGYELEQMETRKQRLALENNEGMGPQPLPVTPNEPSHSNTR